MKRLHKTRFFFLKRTLFTQRINIFKLFKRIIITRNSWSLLFITSMDFIAVINAATHEELNEALKQFCSLHHTNAATTVSSGSPVCLINKHDAVKKVVDILILSVPSGIEEVKISRLEKGMGNIRS